VQFECKVEGNPRPQIAWFRETAIIKPSQDFQMFYDDDNVATLIIREVFPEDAGQFTVVAKNAAGFTSSTTELIVESPLSDHGSDATALSRRSMSRESSLADILEGIPKLKPKKHPKPAYSVQDEEEEQFLIGIRHPKRDSVTYDEDSLTFKKKRKVVQQLFNEGKSAYVASNGKFCIHQKMLYFYINKYQLIWYQSGKVKIPNLNVGC